jgi:murein DD-endopeptidase MepM/ murein hydrolase activator NlpD
VITAIAAAVGVGIEVPRWLIGRQDASLEAGAAGTAGDGEQRLSSGTPASLAKGPFFPIIGGYDFGEGDARFGASRGGRLHEGQDMFAKEGTPLVAVRDGVVVESKSENSSMSGGRGNYIGIYSPVDERTYVYLHMLEPSPLRAGDGVKAGERIGDVGCTGSCYGVHLHFEIRLGRGVEAKPIDPLPHLKRWPQAPAPSEGP